MKQFELKFYREWYDALSELSREDRAAAALALLDYVYSGEIPDDQFIRIVTTLMRNRIDREKASQLRRQSEKNPEARGGDFSEIATESHPEASESDFSEIASEPQSGSVVEPLGETVSSCTAECSVGESFGEAVPESDPEIDSIIQTHYSPQSESFLRLCSKMNLIPDMATKHALKFLLDWRSANPSALLPVPIRIPGAKISPIDSYIIENCHAVGNSPAIASN